MRIGFVSTRLAGTDGVSLETRKWAAIFRRLGHEVFYCAGELDEDLPGLVEPLMHFRHPQIQTLNIEAFQQRRLSASFSADLEQAARIIERRLEEFVRIYRIQVLVVENALTIPMNLAFGVALQRFLARGDLLAIAHHHDFYWERERFLANAIPELLDTVFPPDLPNLKHVVINSMAQRSLWERRRLASVVVPNIFDFSQAAPGITHRNADLRRALQLDERHLLILQPTRVVRRKGIELSLALVRQLRRRSNRRRLLDKEPVLLISHHAGDEGWEYLEELHALAQRWRVPLVYAAAHFHARPDNQPNAFSLWDAYVHADFVTYPSLYEGFGNALLEAVYFRLPVMVNRYHVFAQDIAPLGFDFIEIDGRVTEETVAQVVEVLRDPVRRRRMVERNYQLAREHFSYEAVLPVLAALVEGKPLSEQQSAVASGALSSSTGEKGEWFDSTQARSRKGAA